MPKSMKIWAATLAQKCPGCSQLSTCSGAARSLCTNFRGPVSTAASCLWLPRAGNTTSPFRTPSCSLIDFAPLEFEAIQHAGEQSVTTTCEVHILSQQQRHTPMSGTCSGEELLAYWSSVLTYCLVKFLLLNAESSPSSQLYNEKETRNIKGGWVLSPMCLQCNILNCEQKLLQFRVLF